MGFVADYNVIYAGRLALGAAVRFDKNYNFKDDTTYHFQASYKFDMGLRLHAAAGSGVKNPGMYELFAYSTGTFVGNPDLKPEQSQGWEAGFEQTLFDTRALIGVTYFSSILQDEIATKYVYTSTGYYSTPYNATKSSPQRGIEANITVHLDNNWSADIAYTYLHARQDGLQEVRRAPNIGSFNLAWNAQGGDFGANLTVRYNGEQQDYDYTVSPTGRANLKAFTLLNTDGFWKINDTFRLYGRVENLADEKYEEVYTFRTSGRAFYAGVKAGF
jgi:vitamin B12 transporter